MLVGGIISGADFTCEWRVLLGGALYVFHHYARDGECENRTQFFTLYENFTDNFADVSYPTVKHD
jgi:hypothetical protein